MSSAKAHAVPMPAVDLQNPGKVAPEHVAQNVEMLRQWKERNLRGGSTGVHLCAVCGWACAALKDARDNVVKPERLVCGYAGEEHSGIIPPSSPARPAVEEG